MKYEPRFVPNDDQRHAYQIVKFAVEDGIGYLYYIVRNEIRKDFEENGTIV